MKKMLIIASALMLQACSFGVGFRVDLLQRLRESVSVRTNLPLGRNLVFVSAPMSIHRLVVKKVDQWTPEGGLNIAAVTSGNGIAVRFSGLFSDQRMTIFVTGYDEKGQKIGSKSRVFYANDSGNSASIETWEVSRSELQSR